MTRAALSALAEKRPSTSGSGSRPAGPRPPRATRPTARPAPSASRAGVGGTGRQDVLERVDRRALHLVEELAGIGRHRFDEAPLPLGEDGVERQRRLARARGTCDHGHRSVRYLAVDSLEIVGTGSYDPDGWFVRHRQRASPLSRRLRTGT